MFIPCTLASWYGCHADAMSSHVHSKQHQPSRPHGSYLGALGSLAHGPRSTPLLMCAQSTWSNYPPQPSAPLKQHSVIHPMQQAAAGDMADLRHATC